MLQGWEKIEMQLEMLQNARSFNESVQHDPPEMLIAAFSLQLVVQHSVVGENDGVHR
jgi:hypothetical protein